MRPETARATMTHCAWEATTGKGGYDVATVVIEASAQQVYETAVQRLQAHTEAVKVIEQNP